MTEKLLTRTLRINQPNNQPIHAKLDDLLALEKSQTDLSLHWTFLCSSYGRIANINVCVDSEAWMRRPTHGVQRRMLSVVNF